MVGTVLMPSLAALTNTVMLLLFLNTDDTKVTFVAWMDLRYGSARSVHRDNPTETGAAARQNLSQAVHPPTTMRLSYLLRKQIQYLPQ